jgi:hypothetical protein
MLKTQLLLIGPCLLVLGLAGWLTLYFRPSPDPVEECAACLPSGVTLDTCFRRDGWDDPQRLTVRDRLRELGAYRRAHVGFEAIYGADGLPIQFYVPRCIPYPVPRCIPYPFVPKSSVRMVDLKAPKQEAVRAVTPVQDWWAGTREREEQEMAALKKEWHLIVLWSIDRRNPMP